MPVVRAETPDSRFAPSCSPSLCLALTTSIVYTVLEYGVRVAGVHTVFMFMGLACVPLGLVGLGFAIGLLFGRKRPRRVHSRCSRVR